MRHPVSTGSGDVLAPSDADVPDTGFWNPERSASGPVTIVMSRSDQALIVLRNGVEIGRSPISLDQGNDATHVLTLTEDADGQPAWVFAGVSGHEDEAGRVVDEATRNLVRIPREFHEQVVPILRPGTTLLVTQAPLRSGQPGTGLTVISSSP